MIKHSIDSQGQDLEIVQKDIGGLRRKLRAWGQPGLLCKDR